MFEDCIKPCRVIIDHASIRTVQEFSDNFDIKDIKSDHFLTAKHADSEVEKKISIIQEIKYDFDQEISHSKPDISQQVVTKSKIDPYQSLSIAIEALINCEFIMELIEAAEVMQLKNSALEQLKSAKDILTTLLVDMNDTKTQNGDKIISEKVGIKETPAEKDKESIPKKEEGCDNKENNIYSVLESVINNVEIEEFSVKEEENSLLSEMEGRDYDSESIQKEPLRTNRSRRARRKPKKYIDYDEDFKYVDLLIKQDKDEDKSENIEIQSVPPKKKKTKPKNQTKKKVKDKDWTETATLKEKKLMSNKDDLPKPEKLSFTMSCSHCNKNITCKAKNQEEADQKLDQHIQRVHFNRFPCYICNDAVFSDALTLSRHRQRHFDNERIVCPICAKTIGAGRYNAHLRRHEGVRKYQCDQCEKNFIEKFHLKEHKRTHTGEKPFSCEFCGKTFYKQSHYTRHKFIHTGQKPHVCILCGKGFNQSYNLTVHMRSHASGQLPVTNYTSDETVPKDED